MNTPKQTSEIKMYLKMAFEIDIFFNVIFEFLWGP